MNREKAKNFIKENPCRECEDGIWTDTAYELVDMIFDDFESRVCKNCYWYGKNSCYCEVLHYEFYETFGCNKFKQKESK